MTRTIAAIAAVAFLACGGGGGGSPSGKVCEGASTTPSALDGDHAPRFAGKWVGTLTTVLDGQTSTDLAGLVLTAKGVNLLETNVCAGLPALVTGLDTFDTVCFVCPPEDVSGVCSSMVVTYSVGSGALSNVGSQLDVQLSGSVDGCGYHWLVTQTFAYGSRFVGARAEDEPGAEPVSLSSLAIKAATQAR